MTVLSQRQSLPTQKDQQPCRKLYANVDSICLPYDRGPLYEKHALARRLFRILISTDKLGGDIRRPGPSIDEFDRTTAVEIDNYADDSNLSNGIDCSLATPRVLVERNVSSNLHRTKVEERQQIKGAEEESTGTLVGVSMKPREQSVLP